MDRLIDKIRTEYPHPITRNEAYMRYDGFYNSYMNGRLMVYCVNIAGSEWWRFHRSGSYPVSGLEQAKIVEANNKGNFELAWELLSNALEVRNIKMKY